MSFLCCVIDYVTVIAEDMVWLALGGFLRLFF
jgi:hypothetical protein